MHFWYQNWPSAPLEGFNCLNQSLAGGIYIFNSVSLPWLGAFKSEMIKWFDRQTHKRTQQFIIEDDLMEKYGVI